MLYLIDKFAILGCLFCNQPISNHFWNKYGDFVRIFRKDDSIQGCVLEMAKLPSSSSNLGFKNIQGRLYWEMNGNWLLTLNANAICSLSSTEVARRKSCTVKSYSFMRILLWYSGRFNFLENCNSRGLCTKSFRQSPKAMFLLCPKEYWWARSDQRAFAKPITFR